MKEHISLPSGLLLAYAVYSAFIPVTIAHSIILLSLAALYGFHVHISRQEKHKLNTEVLRQLKMELKAEIAELKEAHEKKLSKVEDEVAKVQLNTMPNKAAASSASLSTQPRKLNW